MGGTRMTMAVGARYCYYHGDEDDEGGSVEI